MSFLSGILDIGKSVVGFFSGGGIVSSLAKTALLGFALNKLSSSANKGNSNGASTANIDQGVRLQIAPNADSKIPVLYGNAYFGGNINDAAMTNSNKTMWYSIVLAEKVGTKIGGGAVTYTFNNIYWNDQRVIFNSDGITVNYTVDRSGNIDRSLSGLVKIYCYRGGSSAGVVPSGYTGTVPNAFALFPNWTSGTHPMDNLIFALVRVDYNRDKNVTGLGTMLFNVSNDMYQPGNVIYDYLTNTRYGAGVDPADVNTTSLTDLNTYSAENLAYDDQGTGLQNLEDRYQINGLLDTAQNVLSNVEKVCNAAATWLSYDITTGQWGVIINKAGTSVASFTDDTILGNIEVSGTGLQDLYNNVKVEFPHRDLRDSGDFVNIELDSIYRNPHEEDNVLNISYDIINEPIQAQLLGFIELKQSRIDLIIQFQTDFSKINLKAGDIIDVTNSRFGFTSKLFRIITISEVQDDGGALSVDITALEYDSGVYSTADLYRYTRSDTNGIITIGSIGVPGTPNVTKYEVDVRPRVSITSTAPTGIVEGLEFWLTTNVTEPVDDNRSYTLIGTRKPIGGGVFTSGTTVELEYDSIGSTNFLIKTRGFNTTTVGPYSDVSGAVYFEPTQVTDGIGADTQAYNSTGGLLTALALTTLLSKLGDLFGSDGSKSIFEKVFDIFKDETGVDLVGEASAGSLVVASNLIIKGQGTGVTTTTASIDFKNGLTATATGNDVTAKIIDGTAQNQTLVWTGTDWALNASCCPYDPITPVTPPVVTPCSLNYSALLPASAIDTIPTTGCSVLTPLVPHTGSYYITYNNSTTAGSAAGETSKSLNGPVLKGTGNVKLYKTDGTLVQTIAAAGLIIDHNVVELAFNTRELGTDYFITMDEGVVTYCNCKSPKIDDATTWNFRTAPYSVAVYAKPTPGQVGTYTDTVRPNELIPTSYTPTGEPCSNVINISMTFNEEIEKVAGSVEVIDADTLALVTSLSVGTGTISTDKKTITWSSVSGLAAAKDYRVNVPANIVRTIRASTTGCGETVPQVPNNAHNWAFTTGIPLVITGYDLCSEPFAPGITNVHPLSNISITFSKAIKPKASGAANVHIYEANGTLHQTINLNATYIANKVGIIDIDSGGNVLLLQPTKMMKSKTSYYINIDSGAILDAVCDVIFAGISDTSTITWTTDGIETTPPAPLGGQPIETANATFEFGRPVAPGNGRLNVFDSSGRLVSSVASNDPAITYST